MAAPGIIPMNNSKILTLALQAKARTIVKKISKAR
jgi:hypothetical protein